MIMRTATHLCARWPAALLTVSRSFPSSGTWESCWSAFFKELEVRAESHRDGTDKATYTKFDVVPTPLLRSIAQHWVDKALLDVVSARLAEVYPPAQTGVSKGAGEAAVMLRDELELLVTTWSAHMLLSVLHTPLQESIPASHTIQGRANAAPDNVSAALADCLEKDVAPVLRYLSAFAAPLESRSTHLHHNSVAPRRVLRHALVLLLSSFVTRWREAPPHEISPPPRAISLTREERALAMELCCCIAALDERSTGWESIVAGEHRRHANPHAHLHDASAEATELHVTSLEAVINARFSLVKDALAGMRGPDEGSDGGVAIPSVSARDSAVGSGPLRKACEAWVASHVGTAVGVRTVSPSSLFAGITDVRRKEEEDVDVIERVNDQLSEIARSSTANTVSR